jgi:hypothetical protein
MFSTSVTPLPNLQSCRLMIRLLKNNNANKGKKKRLGGGGACWTLCKQNSKVTFIGHSFRYWVVSVVFFSVVVVPTWWSFLHCANLSADSFFLLCCVAEPTFFIFAYGYIHRYIHAVFLLSLALVGTFAVPSSRGLPQPGICLRQWTDGRDWRIFCSSKGVSLA